MDPRLLALHTHWLIADSVKYAVFHESSDSKDAKILAKLGPDLGQLAKMHSAMWRLSVFHALQYVVIEGYKELAETDQDVDALLEPGRVDPLRRFRNAIFHYQPQPLSHKLLAFLEQPEAAEWARKLHGAFERYLRKRLDIAES